MQKLTRREFVLMCGSAAAGIIGSTFVFSKLPKEIETKYISNIMVNPNEFLILNKDSKGIIYILINGILMQGQEEEFANELISRGIINHDGCDIYTLPKKEDGLITPIEDISIETKDNINYTFTSNSKDKLDKIEKYQSDLLAKNSDLFKSVNSKTK